MSKRRMRSVDVESSRQKNSSAWHYPKLFEAVGVAILLVAWILEWSFAQDAEQTQKAYDTSVANISAQMVHTHMAWTTYSSSVIALERQKTDPKTITQGATLEMQALEFADYRKSWVQRFVADCYSLRATEQVTRLISEELKIHLPDECQSAEEDLRKWMAAFKSILGENTPNSLYDDPIDERAWKFQKGTYFAGEPIDSSVNAPTEQQLTPQTLGNLSHQLSIVKANHAVAVSAFSNALAVRQERRSRIYHIAYGVGTIVIFLAFVADSRRKT